MNEFEFRLDKDQLESELNGVAIGYLPSKEWVDHIRVLIEKKPEEIQ